MCALQNARIGVLLESIQIRPSKFLRCAIKWHQLNGLQSKA